MSPQFRALAAPTKGLGSVLGTHMPTHNLLSTVPEDLMPSSSLHEYFTHMTHVYSQAPTYTHEKKINAEVCAALICGQEYMAFE